MVGHFLQIRSGRIVWCEGYAELHAAKCLAAPTSRPPDVAVGKQHGPFYLVLSEVLGYAADTGAFGRATDALAKLCQ